MNLQLDLVTPLLCQHPCLPDQAVLGRQVAGGKSRVAGPTLLLMPDGDHC